MAKIYEDFLQFFRGIAVYDAACGQSYGENPVNYSA